MTRTRFARVAVLAAFVAGTVIVPGAVATPAGAATPKWTVVKSPSPPGPPLGEVDAVSCATSTSCFAVGDGTNGPLIERWNGAGWSIVKSPSLGGETYGALEAVSCATPTSCVAIGYQEQDSQNVGVIVDDGSSSTLAERWDGRRWSLLPSPTPPSDDEVQLAAISCPSAKQCFAVGYRFDDSPSGDGEIGGKVDPIVVHWDGSTWSSLRAATTPGAFLTMFSGISCVSAKNCFAVGDAFGANSAGSLIEHWNGVKWSIVPSPRQGSNAPHMKYRLKRGRVTTVGVSGGLDGVSCANATSCFAVGGNVSGGTLTERWNGKKWKIVPSPALPAGTNGELDAVSCARPSDCSAVGGTYKGFDDGDGGDSDYSDTPLAEHWNGSAWTVQAQPLGAQFSALDGVSCPAPKNCAAVGGSAFVQHWNGTRWKVAPFTTKMSQSHLYDISCLHTTSCVAVGLSSNGSITQPLIERRVGSRWRIDPAPTVAGAVQTSLGGVSCTTTTDCTAVGGSFTIDTDPNSFGLSAQPLIEHWNGSAWSIVPTPPNPQTISSLTDVDCTRSTSCTAVGSVSSFTDALSASKPLIEHWNGSAWSVVPSPRPAFGEAVDLASVSCSGPNKCTVVGYYEAVTGNRSEVARTLVDRWDGTRWSRQPSPNLKGKDLSALFSVSCPTANNCSAIGESESFSGTNAQPLSEHWNGKHWVIVPSAIPHGSFGSTLASISCRGTSSCWAVGGYSTAVANRTLVEHWNGTRWGVVPSPTPANTSGVGLSGISCASRTTCTAVGSFGVNNGFFTLIERGP